VTTNNTTDDISVPSASEMELKPYLFKQVLEASGVAMAIRDTTLAPIFANRAFLDFYGYTMAEVHATPKETMLPDPTIVLYREIIIPFMRSGQSWEGEYAIRTKPGRLNMVWGRFDPVMNTQGELTHVISIMRDASASKRLRNALTQTERHLQFLADNTSDCLFRIRLADGRYDYISSAVENITGYSPQEFYETPRLFEVLTPSEYDDTMELWWSEFQAGITRTMYESPLVHKNGSLRWVSQRITLVRDPAGKPIAAEGIITDTTEAKHAEGALKESEGKYRFLAENITDVIWHMDNDLNFTYATPSAEKLWGYKPEELTEMDYRELLTQEGLTELEFAHRNRADAEAKGDLEHVNRLVLHLNHKRGDRVWIETAVKRLYDEQGIPVGYQGVSRDISDRQEHEAILRRGEARFRTLFEDSPISLWEEDLTRLKGYFDELKKEGVEDFRQFFHDNPDRLAHCATLVDVVAVNKATLDLLRASSQEELFGNLDKVLTESSMAAFTEEMILLASGGYEYSGEITHKTLEGDIIWVVVHFLVPPEYQNTLSRVIVSLIDVTPRKRAEQALMESEERYRVVVENVQEGVLIIQRNVPVFMNEALEEICGYSPAELHELSLFNLILPEYRELVRDLYREFKSEKLREGFVTVRIMTKHGEIHWVTVNLKNITWGGEDAYMQVISDITPYKDMEKELRLAHADMEERVRQRTQELSNANVQLTQEISERKNAQEHILSLTQQLLRIQEDERSRIARDLHDNVAQDLSSIVLNVETLFDGSTTIAPEIVERGQYVASIARNAIASVRDIAYGLRPPALDQLGLQQALERHCEEVMLRTGVDVDFFAAGIENAILDFDTEINVYRMVQESLNNISKHAKADKASVRLVSSYPDLLVRVSDNGCGFDVDKRLAQAVDERRMGLKSMEERARLIGGSMDIQSKLGSGTRIAFRIPTTNERR